MSSDLKVPPLLSPVHLCVCVCVCVCIIQGGAYVLQLCEG